MRLHGEYHRGWAQRSAAGGPWRGPAPGPRCGLLTVLLMALGLSSVCGAEVDPARLPPAAPRPVDYDRDVRPLFEAACFRCHGPEMPKSGFRLDNRESALKGGKLGVAIRPGQSAESPLIHYVARLVEDLEMPPAGKGDPLTPEQVGVLRAWIDQGAPYPDSAATARQGGELVATPVFRYVSVSGNERKFREHWWIPEGASGGIERFEWTEDLGEGRRFRADGRILGGANDYRLHLSLSQADLGFVRAGYEEFTKWSDDVGGYYQPFRVPPFALDQELELDVGRAYFEAGLARPNLPRLTLGYEYQFRDGDKSTTQWGTVTEPTTFLSRAIYPSARTIDDQTHILKADVAYDVAGFALTDEFRGEWHDGRSERANVDSFTLGNPLPDVITRYQEETQHFQAANAFRLERWLKDGWLVSGGYLYSHHDGNAAFAMESFIPSDPALGPFVGALSQEIVLERDAHVFNGNTHIVPWRDLRLTAGVQADWTRQTGFGQALIAGFPSPYSADTDRLAVDERVSLQFTALPYSVLYAEAALQQESLGQFEQQTVEDDFDGPNDFLRDTDATADLGDYRVGWTFSPWQRVSFDAGYRNRTHQTEYEHLTDTDAYLYPGSGYPAFILARDIAMDEVHARLVLHPARWLKTSFRYQWVTTDFDSVTADWVDLGTEQGRAGGPIRAGEYDAHTYTLNATVTPWRRLLVHSTLIYADAETRTGMDTVGAVVPYAGDTWTLLCGGTFVLDDRTDLTASYAFSRADFAQGNWASGLPLGIEYDRHGLLVGLARRFKHDWSVRLEYGFFDYAEPTAAGASDYTAHAIFASVSKRLR